MDTYKSFSECYLLLMNLHAYFYEDKKQLVYRGYQPLIVQAFIKLLYLFHLSHFLVLEDFMPTFIL